MMPVDLHNTKLLDELATKARMDVGDLRSRLGEAASSVLQTESSFADIWIESLNSKTVIVGIADFSSDNPNVVVQKFLEFEYAVTDGEVSIDVDTGREVLRTFEPVSEFEKDVVLEDGSFVTRFEITGKETEDGRRAITGYASVFDLVDRDGEKMMRGAFAKGLPTFMSSPAMLYNHGRDPEVGRNAIGVWKTVREDDRGLFVEGEIAIGDKHADRLWNLVKQGALNALSVGGRHAMHGKDIYRWDLVEISLVTVPANAFAIFSVVKDVAFLPVAMLEAPDIVGRLVEREKSLEGDDAGNLRAAIHAAASTLTDLISQAGELVATGKVADTDSLVRNELQPAMAMGVKALEEGTPVMDLTDDQLAAIGAAAGAASATTLAAVLDARDTASKEADEKAATEKTAQEEHDKGIADVAVEKAMKDFKTMLRDKGFVPAGALDLPVSDDDGEGGEGTSSTKALEDMTPRELIASGFHKYDRLDERDMAYAHMMTKAVWPHLEQNIGHLWRPNTKMLRAMAVKAAKMFAAGKLPDDIGYMYPTKWVETDDDGGGYGEKEVLAPWAMKADELMGSDVATAGDEWVPTLWTSQLWEQIRLTNQVVSFLASAGNVIDMPSDPFIAPLESTDPTVLLAPQTDDDAEFVFGAGPVASTKVGTANLTMTTGKLMVLIPFSRELEEDAILPVVPQLRRQTERAMENAIENVIINGDTTIGSGTNINANDTTPAGTEKFLTADGLRHLGLVTTTADSLDIGTLTLGKIRNMRKLMGTNGKMGIRSSDLMMIADGQTYYELLDLDEVVTADKFGPQATVKTGGLESIDGIRIHASEEMGITGVAGTIDFDTSANNTKGQIVIWNRNQFKLGYRRRLTMSVEKVPFADGGYLVASLRVAFTARDAEGVAVGYNITI